MACSFSRREGRDYEESRPTREEYASSATELVFGSEPTLICYIANNDLVMGVCTMQVLTSKMPCQSTYVQMYLLSSRTKPNIIWP